MEHLFNNQPSLIPKSEAYRKYQLTEEIIDNLIKSRELRLIGDSYLNVAELEYLITPQNQSGNVHRPFAHVDMSTRYNPPHKFEDLGEEDLQYMINNDIGEGSVFFNNTRQKWQVALSLGYKENGKRNRKIITAQSEVEAWKILGNFKTDNEVLPFQSAQEIQKGQGITLRQAIDNYLEGERNKSDRGFESKLGMCKIIINSLGDKRLDEINTGMIKIFLSDITNAEYTKGKVTSYYSQGHLDKIFIYLKAVFSLAVDDEYIDKNPMKPLKKKSYISKKPNEHKAKAFSSEEIVKLECAMSEHIMFLTINTIMRFTGVRPGEAYALKWEDFDFEKGVVKIRRALSYSSEYDKAERKAQKRKPIFKNLKNDKNSRNTEITPYRDIPINDDVIKAVEKWRQFVETAKCNSRTLYIFDSERGDYYFMDKDGNNKHVEPSKIANLPTIMEKRRENGMSDYLFSKLLQGTAALPDYYAQEYGKVLEANGLDSQQYKVYRFRHTYCTVCLKNLNNDIKAVQMLMGDSDPTMILKVYNSIRREDVMAEATIKVLNGLKDYTQGEKAV